MTTPERKFEYHHFPGFQVVQLWCQKGYQWRFSMWDQDISLGAYYRGKMICTNAARKDIVGTVFTGFYDFSRYPELNTLHEWQECVIEDDMDWYCFHEDGGGIKSIAFRSTLTPLVVPPNTDVIVVEGQLSDGRGELAHIPFGNVGHVLSGDAKVVLLTR
jgi:hypothetical protein